jgi:hypothetical protein
MQPAHYRRDYEGTIGPLERSVAPPASAEPIRPLRMLTILIEDVRSGVPDHQLAEVQVHLRPSEDPEGGFWANAKEICEKLQAGPSRIDGKLPCRLAIRYCKLVSQVLRGHTRFAGNIASFLCVSALKMTLK